jgi:hypothetical protein
VPVNFGYRDDAFYFHSATEGKKIDLIRKNNRVCFEIEADFGLVKRDIPCKWNSRYASVIGFGRAYFIEGSEDKRKGLEIIFRHYSSDPFEELTTSLDAVAIVKIEVESMTGKVSGMS